MWPIEGIRCYKSYNLNTKTRTLWYSRNSKNWLINYLTNRTQFVEIENTKSQIISIECGVPQGSILGPLIYLIYVDDNAKSTNGHILPFTDDTSLYLSDPKIDELYEMANIEVNTVYEWFCANMLSLNPSQTKFIVMRTPNNPPNSTGFKLCINGTPLVQIGTHSGEKSTKCLGRHIDELISWKTHFAHINTKHRMPFL